ncbi:MAG: alpha/beta hydrolase [Phycisphaeraceae bacterium]|nr:alpha/beta hydrolase [Phycisphaeraceae bacterium]
MQRTDGPDPDTFSEWKTRLLRAAEDAERRVAGLLDRVVGEADGKPARPNGLHLVPPGGAEVSITGAPSQSGLIVSRRAVLLIHGLDEPGSIWDQLIPELHAAGHTVVRFDYPNDQAAADSASLLARAMSDLRDAGCDRVDLVCHSMGGLLAYDLLTRDEFVPSRKTWPRVDRFIALGTPFGGSPFARLRAIAEVRDRIERWLDSDRKDRNALLDWKSDGNGEAGADLMPGSAYLNGLAERALPDDIQTTVIIARIADVSPPDLTGLTDSWLFRSSIGDAEIESITRAIRGVALEVGDGVVSESSARAIPFEDTVVVSSNHREMLATVRSAEAVRRAVKSPAIGRTPPALPVVLDRLSKPIDSESRSTEGR